MGFYVNLEMPKDCPMCPFAYYDVFNTFMGCDITRGKRWAVKNDKDYAESSTRPDWCPLIEVPEPHDLEAHEPHGWLILADELIEFIENRYEITWKDDYKGGIKDACVDILEKISTMPRYSSSESKERPAFLPQYELTPRSEEGKT